MNYVLYTAALIAIATSTASSQVATERPRFQATRIAQAPRIDGSLDDAAWRDAVWISTFTQREPVEKAAPSSPTSIAIRYDDNALYIGARMTSASPVRALVTRRDREGSSDQIVVSLDSYNDRRTAYSFGITAAGVREDYFHSDDSRALRDYTFDPVWEARARIDSMGWTAEMRIPFTQLRFAPGDTLSWGINAVRIIPSLNEEDYLVFVGRRDAGWASRFGELAGITNISGARRVELMPYVATDARLHGAPDARNPFDYRTQTGIRSGGDLKIGLGPNLTLDATFNPDFGQVEADPAEVNLSAFETFFAERRPFFVEGSQLLRANGAGWFYTRRVGAAPHLRAVGDYAEIVQSTTILGAAKITGRLPSRVNLGIFAAVTDRESARGFRLSDSTFSLTEVEPRTAYGVVRMQKEFGSSGSNYGGIITGLGRQFDAASPSSQVLARTAVSGAFDWNLRTRNGSYSWVGALGYGGVNGDSAAIVRIQQLPAHYYQRPDASEVRLDPARRSVGGAIISTTANKSAGKLLVQLGGFREWPGLEVNDAGRIGASNDQGAYATIRYRQTTPSARLYSYDVAFSNYTEWNFGGIRQVLINSLLSNVIFKNFWTLSADVNNESPNLLDDLTRGGPLMGRPRTTSANAALTNGVSSKTRLSVGAGGFADGLNGQGGYLNGRVSASPGTRWELSWEPRYSHNVFSQQYVTTLPGGSAATFGRRYVFSAIERSELVSRVRLNYAFSPDVTLETYLEPFVSSGRYFDQGELSAAGSYTRRRYGADGTTATRNPAGNLTVMDGAQTFTITNRDFTVRSFRSNVVTRWEWRPGSTLFLVWQQNRSASDVRGPLVTTRGLFDTLSETGDNFLAVKISYWLAAK